MRDSLIRLTQRALPGKLWNQEELDAKIYKEREKRIKSSSSSPLFTSLTEQNDRGRGANFSGENVVEIFIS
jgi:hypothetical protein